MTSVARSSKLNPPDRLLILGYAVLGVLFTIIAGWSALVPLAESVVAPGTVSVAAQRRTIAHLEGGAVSALKVDEGDYVDAGQVLLQLDDRDLRSQLTVLEYERFAHQAKLEHLLAEREKRASIAIGSLLHSSAASNPEYLKILQNEINAHGARIRSFETQSDSFKERIRQGSEQLGLLRQQLDSLERQQVIIQQQSRDADSLLAKGFGTKSRASELRLEGERVLSTRLKLEAEVDSVAGTVRDARLGQDQLIAENSHKIEDSLSQTRRKLSDLDGQIRKTRDRLDSLKIKSTIRGVIVDLQVQSINDVIEPASPILDILPIDSAYLVEVQLPSDKIEGLVEGMKAEVRLRGVTEERAISIPGRVAMVSADIINDPKSQFQYYRVHVSLTENQGIDQSLKITPGMPADVIFQKRDRTIFEYFLAPLMDHLSRSAA